MALSVTTDITTISNCDSVTGWAGGIEQFAVETGVKQEGTGSLCAWIDLTTSAVEYYTITAQSLVGKLVYVWFYCSGVVDTRANGGYRIVLYTDASNYATFYVGGNDTHKAKWNLCFCDPSYTGSLRTTVGTFNPASVTRIGIQFKTLTNAIKKGQTFVQNCFWDAVRVGTGFTITSAATDQITLQNIVDWDEGASTRFYGIVQEVYGAYLINGKLTFGSVTAGVHCDMNMDGEVMLYQDNELVGATSNTIQVLGNATGTTNLNMTGSFVKANNVQCIFDVDGANLNTINVVGNTFDNVNCSFTSSQTITSNVFANCTQVVPGLSTFKNNTIKQTIATTGALLFPSDESNFSDNIFIDNTTGAAIQHSSATGSPFDYNNITFSGNTYDVNNTSGSAIQVYKNGTSNPTTYTGSLVTFLGAAVVTQIEVKDLSTGSVIENARVLVWPTNGTNFPYQASISIVSSGTTATVTHTSHGLASNDFIIIRGANEDAYNGAFQITVTGTNTYTYTMLSSAGTPATGTITATFAFIAGLTNSSGIISDSRIVNSDQTITGWVRKASASPYYQPQPIVGTVSSVNGFSTTIQLPRDE